MLSSYSSKARGSLKQCGARTGGVQLPKPHTPVLPSSDLSSLTSTILYALPRGALFRYCVRYFQRSVCTPPRHLSGVVLKVLFVHRSASSMFYQSNPSTASERAISRASVPLLKALF